MITNARQSPISRLRRWVVTSILTASLASPAFANDYPELRELMRKGRLDEAGRQVASLLRDTPRDPDLLFAQAVIAERAGDIDRAMTLYRDLNRRHPGLLEPYNNLAILEARQGNYKAAVEVLESALEANPSVATAYQNLTAIYAQLASAAYRKALNSETPLQPLQLASLDQLEPLPGAVAQQTPSLVASVENFVSKSLDSAPSEQTGEQEIVLAAAGEEPEVIGRTGSDKPSSTTVRAEVVETPAAGTNTPEPSASIALADSPVDGNDREPAPTETKPVVVAAATPTAEARKAVEEAAAQKQNLINHVKSWARAWSDRDVDRYLDHYSDSFIPRNGLTHAEWRKQRYGRLRWREFIEVEPSGFSVELDGNTAKVNFTQYYKSDRMEDTIPKTLVMKRENGRWLIVRELI